MKRIVVIGGGVSGLVAARRLAENGFSVVLVEAKDRVGGRILTHHVDGTIAELGAEFVHGRSEQMLHVIREAKLELIDASESNRIVKNGGMEKVDLWERVDEVMKNIDPHERDTSFGDWLARCHLDAETKELALAFVEGFNASDARVIGAHALLRAEYASEHSEGDKQSRLQAIAASRWILRSRRLFAQSRGGSRRLH